MRVSEKAKGLFIPTKITKRIEGNTTEENQDRLYGCLWKSEGKRLSYDDPLMQLMDYTIKGSTLTTF